ncbi:hypothetical protein C0J52_15551 [Blattella germanica]|nr:hypothetical protein C0J52_15551 [Blattella germanica]
MERDDMIRQWLDELTDVSEIDIPRDPDSDDSDTEQPNNSDHNSNSELSGDEEDPDSPVHTSPQYVGRDNVTLWCAKCEVSSAYCHSLHGMP